MMEVEKSPIDVVAIIPQDAVWQPFLQAADSEGFQLHQAVNFKQGQYLIKREGYRFRIVLVDVGIANGVTDWVAGIGNRFPWIVFAIHGAGEDVASKEMTGKGPAKADFSPA